MEIFLEFLKIYYLPVLVLLSTLFVILINRETENRLPSLWTLISAILTFVLIVSEYLGDHVFEKSSEIPLRLVFGFLGYTLKPFLIISVMKMAFTEKKSFWFLYIAAAVNAALYVTCFFTRKITFGYIAGEDGFSHFQRGALGYTAHVISALILAAFFIISLLNTRKNHRGEILPTIFFVIGCVIATLMETFGEYPGALMSIVSVSIMFYYLFLYMLSSRKDILTGLYNRRTFYADLDMQKNSVTGILSIDMNGLKVLNDRYGHEAGDKALATIAGVFHSCINRRMDGYRVGGDEFAIICVGSTKEEMERVAGGIRISLADTPYTCSIGIAHISECESVSDLLTRADAKMYEEKNKFYEKMRKAKEASQN